MLQAEGFQTARSAALHDDYRRLVQLRLVSCLALLLAGCAFKDSDVAAEARSRLIGLSEAELESCIGAPDQHSSFDNTDVLTYYASSTSNLSWSLPVVGGIGLTNGGYCHATFQITNGRVVRLLYSGEKNASLAADAFCAPIVRTCLANVDQIRHDNAGADERHGQALASPQAPGAASPVKPPARGALSNPGPSAVAGSAR